jgi:hypothetical protein
VDFIGRKADEERGGDEITPLAGGGGLLLLILEKKRKEEERQRRESRYRWLMHSALPSDAYLEVCHTRDDPLAASPLRQRTSREKQHHVSGRWSFGILLGRKRCVSPRVLSAKVNHMF